METVKTRRIDRVTFGLIPEIYDKVTRLTPDSVTEVYVYSLMAADGTSSIVGYVEVVYTSADKEEILTVSRLAQ